MLTDSYFIACLWFIYCVYYFTKSVECASDISVSVNILSNGAKEREHSIRKRSFNIDFERNCFRKDGKSFNYIAGSMNYYRVPRIYWQDRMKKFLHAGLNAVDT